VSPTVSPTAPPTPTPTEDCVCVPTKIVPQGNLIALKNVGDGGKGSTLTRTVTVKLVAVEASPGSCPAGTVSASPVTLMMVDDDLDGIINSTKNVFCESGEKTHVKFWVEYEGPENCAGSVAPAQQVSRGKLTVTATASGGQLIDELGIQCKK